MKRKKSTFTLGGVFLAGLVLLLVMHSLVLLGLIPYENVWGGQIKNQAELLKYELIALVVTVVFILIILVKQGFIFIGRFKKTAQVGMWFMVAFFGLNAIGNLASGVTAEKMIFMPVAILFSLLALGVALKK